MTYRPTRQMWVALHRYAGLTIAIFLLVAAFTGSLIAFYDQLSVRLNPKLFTVEVSRNAAFLTPDELQRRAAAIEPRASFNAVPLPGGMKEGRSVFLSVEPKIDAATGRPYELGYSALVLDPYRGTKVGTYGPDLWPVSAENLMDVLYAAHFTLLLPENLGIWLFGIAALIWTIDCGVGLYLTLPLHYVSRTGQVPPTGWLRRWIPAWKVRRPARGYKLAFDLHRAGSLWLWLALLVMAWSSVALTLREQIYTPVMRQIFTMKNPVNEIPLRSVPLANPPIDMASAQKIGQLLARQEADRLGISIGPGTYLFYDDSRAVYRYRFVSSAQPRTDPATDVVFSAIDGRRIVTIFPDRQPLGMQITDWITGLHMGRIGGLPIQIVISAMGALVSTLAITGLIIWSKKRKGRVGRKRAKPLATSVKAVSGSGAFL